VKEVILKVDFQITYVDIIISSEIDFKIFFEKFAVKLH